MCSSHAIAAWYPLDDASPYAVIECACGRQFTSDADLPSDINRHLGLGAVGAFEGTGPEAA